MKTILMMLALTACGGSTTGGGDDTTGGVDPKLIAGGGVANAPITSVLHVYAVEVGTSTPIAGATVHVGAATAMTDATGLASFTGLSGEQTVTVTASGHAAATWIGVAGANVTIPLEPPTRTVPTASVSGTITGWNNLPSPPLGKYTLAVILYSFLDDPAAPENAIAQPTNAGAPLDTCIKSAASNSCAWQLTARVGKQLHTAVIVEGDPHGTNSDTSDDTYTFVGIATGQVMTLSAGQTVTNEALTIVPAGALMQLPVTVAAGPAGLSKIVAIPELALGDAGRIVFPLPTLTGSGTAHVLAPTGAYAGHYELVALATPSASAKAPFSSAFVHGVTSAAAVTSWPAPPTQVTGGATFAFTDTSTAAFHTAQLLRGTSVLWDVTLLDGSTSFTLPALSPDPLGTGALTVAVSGAIAPAFDATHFDVPTVSASLTGAAGAQAAFTH